MASTTRIKRQLFAARYARKDARTRIYTALYGPANGDQRSNTPWNDPSRDGRGLSYAVAEHTVRELSNLAGFTLRETMRVQDRLDAMYSKRKEDLA